MRMSDGATAVDRRVKVAIPMSMPRIPGEAGRFDAIDIPLLNMTGTCDTSIIYRTFPKHRRVPFELTKAKQQYLVTIEGVRHESFSNREDRNHERIAAVVIAFLRGFLLHDAQARAWFDEAGISDALGARASVEVK
jgi:alpha-beta hydrolase superfamily lysophospholipase